MPGYLPRLADTVLQATIAAHPAVLVTGPRATGKTTSAARLAASTVQLANDRERTAFAADIEAGLASRHEPILIDEWQEVPATLGHLKTQIDADPRRGRFLVTGSVRGDIDGVTWPATGRLVRVEMHGLIEREVESRLGAEWFHQMMKGTVEPVSTELRLTDYVRRALRSGFPEPALSLDASERVRWLTSYVDHLVTRDAAEVEGGRDPQRLRRYLTAYALNSAGVVDDTTLFQAAGISKNTARAYDRLLQNLFATAEVPAWTSNRLKRLALAPKRYLVDPGLFAGVLGVEASDALHDGDLLGRLIETFVIAQLRAECALAIPRPRLHHLRTAEGRHEIDVVIEVGARRLIAIEIKATSTPGSDDARHLRWFKREMGDAVVAAVLLHAGPETVQFDHGIVACPIAALWS